MPKVKIDENRCKGCLLCIDFCPKQVLAVKETLNKRGVKPVTVKSPSLCIGCGFCVLICPDCCIELER